MIVDKLNEFANSLAVTVTAITDVIDLGATNALKDIASGRQLYLVIQVDTSVTAAGAATGTFTLESDSDAGLSTSPTIHASTEAIGKATLVAGFQRIIALPPGNYERYLGVRCTVGTGPFTAGAISAFLTDAPQANRAYDDGQ